MAILYEHQIVRGLEEAWRLAAIHGGFVLVFAWFEKGNEQVSLYFVHCDGKKPKLLRAMRRKAYRELSDQDQDEKKVMVIVVSDNPDFPVSTAVWSIQQAASLTNE